MSYNRQNLLSVGNNHDKSGRQQQQPHQQQQQQRPHQTVLNFGSDDDTDQYTETDRSIRESLLREDGHLSRSEQLLDEQFDLALRTRENLVNQRWSIKSMSDQFNSVTNRFSAINALVKKIRVRKRRDTIIIAIVFAICLGFLLYNIL